MNDSPTEPQASRLDDVLCRDRYRLRQQRHRLKSAELDAEAAARFESELAAARQRYQHRVANAPDVRYDDDLPIMQHREEIQRLLRERQVIIVAGETGSGKSTQLPKICLESGIGHRGLIGHTQPRRIAARTIAARLSDELRVQGTAKVAYKVRFQDRTDATGTYIKLMTDGILLAETQSDRFLNQYEAIILDEAHERSLNIDFLLGYLKQKLPRRPDLKLIVTSATIDAERFSAHFADSDGPAPIIEVSGRTYPVDVEYRPLIDEEGEERSVTEGVIGAVRELGRHGSGDVLVFLPTERDIRELAKRLRRERWSTDSEKTTEVLPLYARLSAAEQNKIFKSTGGRRIVLATNVAESSLTVPGIRYVIDTGTARMSRYSARAKLTRLPIEPVSRASADQRAGRCGRVAPGICIRLYSEEDYLQRDDYTTPEIRRSNLASVILQAKALKLGELDEFPFIDAPRPEVVRDGYKTLFELQAIDERRRLTQLGRRLARMPVDPRIGRMILAGHEFNCLGEILIIGAVLEIQDPRERPHDRQQLADEKHAQFQDEDSDYLSYLKVWDFYHHLKEDLSRNRLKKACIQNFLSHNRMREWSELHRQLMDVAKQNKLGPGRRSNDYASIHRALLTGLLTGVAYLSSEREYTGAGGVKMSIWPGSGLIRKKHKWIVSAERIETARRYARTVARVSPSWVEKLAGHLVKRSYSDPHWHRKSATVAAYEKVSLSGMPVVAKRRVPYGTIDMETSRRVFIESALVDERVHDLDRFFRENRQLRKEMEALAAKTRRREYLVDDYSIYHFYHDRLPPDVYDVASMRRWIKKNPEHRRLVTMRLADMVDDGGTLDQQAFPEELQVGSLTLPVSYNFQPGEEDDGVSITVPTEALQQLSAGQLEWMVPGLFEERVIALIRSLPKSLRRNFVPVPDTAKQVVELLEFGKGDMLSELAKCLGTIAQEPVRVGDFQLEKLSPHLTMNVRVVDADGKQVAMSRDLEVVRSAAPAGELKVGSTPDESSKTGSKLESEWHRDGLTQWDFGELPPSIKIERGGIEIEAYPCLVDDGDGVNMRLLPSQALAEHLTRRAVARLYALAHRKSLKVQVNHLPRWDEIAVWGASAVDTKTLKNDLQLRIAERAFIGRKAVPRSLQMFEQRQVDAIERIAVATQEVTPLLAPLFEGYHHARLAVEHLTGNQERPVRADIEQQIAELMKPDFLVDVPWMWLKQFPRYFKAITQRIEKLHSGGIVRDAEYRQTLFAFWTLYEQRQAENERLSRFDPELIEFRWMLEELRVSYFAQNLGTFVKVSVQRLEKLFGALSENR